MTNSTTKFSNSTTAYAYLYSNMTQLWTDKLSNIKIQFSYLPEKQRGLFPEIRFA
jgi:hypothetical protein